MRALRVTAVTALSIAMGACAVEPQEPAVGTESGTQSTDTGDGDPGDGEPGDGEPGDGEPGDGDGDAGDGDGDPGDGDGDGDGDGGGDGDGEPEFDPAGMVDLGDFLIGAAEVRVQEYGTFLVADVGFDHLPPECSWKTDYTPGSWNGQVQQGVDWPVRRVDWCDAWAYCDWAGARLCGRVGGQAAGLGEVADADDNEWYRACSADGAQMYPYADSYDPDVCNGLDANYGVVQPVASLPGCAGGASSRIFDMSGNVFEWTNSCDAELVADEEQQCRRRGGSYLSEDFVLRCEAGSTRERSYRYPNTGIRCCASPA